MSDDAFTEVFAPLGEEARVMGLQLQEVQASVGDAISGPLSVELVTSAAQAARLKGLRRLPVWDPDEFQVRVSGSLAGLPGAVAVTSFRFVLLPDGLAPAQLEVYRVLRADGVERSRAVGLACGTVASLPGAPARDL